VTFGMKLLFGAILLAFAAFHAATLYRAAPLLFGPQTAPAAMIRTD
jgi:hypothetical protein